MHNCADCMTYANTRSPGINLGVYVVVDFMNCLTNLKSGKTGPPLKSLRSGRFCLSDFIIFGNLQKPTNLKNLTTLKDASAYNTGSARPFEQIACNTWLHDLLCGRCVHNCAHCMTNANTSSLGIKLGLHVFVGFLNFQTNLKSGKNRSSIEIVAFWALLFSDF